MLSSLRTPGDIQRFLDDLDYDEAGEEFSPRFVIGSGKAQCLSGALFGCAALRELGYAPRIAYIDAVSDDGHCLAVYEHDGLWGAVAKSNYTTLRSREAVYSYVALGLSYFEGYNNQYGKRTMRSFTVPVELEPFEPKGWRFSDDAVAAIDEALDMAPKAWVLPRRSAGRLSKVSEQLLEAGLLGAKPGGLWKKR